MLICAVTKRGWFEYIESGQYDFLNQFGGGGGVGWGVRSCNLSNPPPTVSTPEEKKVLKSFLKLTLYFVALDVGFTTKINKAR